MLFKLPKFYNDFFGFGSNIKRGKLKKARTFFSAILVALKTTNC